MRVIASLFVVSVAGWILLQAGANNGGEPHSISEAQKPMVSVITATYNAATTLEACLRSVQSQDYWNLEHIVVDGASQDATPALLRDYSRPGLRFISEPDSGIYDAWNKGLRLAQGQWIAFLGADDLYLPGAVSAYMQLAATCPEAQYLSARVRLRGQDGDSVPIGGPWQWPRFQRYMCTAHVGSMHRNDLFDTYGNFDVSLRIVADYEFLLRAGANLRAAFLPELTVEMESGGISNSLAALQEAACVKRTTGRRASLLVRLEYAKANAGFRLRKILHG